MASCRSCIVLSACLALALVCPLAFVNPATKVAQRHEVSVARGASEQDGIPASFASKSSTGSLVAAAAAVGAMFGLLKSKRSEISAAAAAGIMGVSTAANAMVDYSGLAYLGGSDKVDINNANVQAYRQFPGMYPTIAGLIGSNGPYKSVSDVYNVKGLTEPMKSVLKQYEGNLVCFPADPAYFIDRVNNGLYR
mmetsp:Transcript_28145/g.65034  ORF Transcript_28145/g.65034 Transcript_28145/m.65034 type:complete len:194 (-) Transcript_28145:45-626(-)